MAYVTYYGDEIVLTFWVITHGTTDYGEKYVVRRQVGLKRGITVADVEPLLVCDTLAEARAGVPEGTVRVPRDPLADHPHIVESWC